MRCIAFDRRGHGRSDRPIDGHDYDRYADDLNELLSHLDLRKVTLVGHSMGSGEIIRYLSRHNSRRISRIILIAPPIPYLLKTDDNMDGIDGHIFEANRKAISSDFPGWLEENSNAFYLPETFAVSPATIQWTINMILTTSLNAALEGTFEVFESDFRKELLDVSVACLIIHGSADASIPVYYGRKAAGLIPNCEYKEYEGAPHGLFITHSDRLNADILEFINTN